jgi:hypothetical protein
MTTTRFVSVFAHSESYQIPNTISICKELTRIRLPLFDDHVRQDDPRVGPVPCAAQDCAHHGGLFDQFAELLTRSRRERHPAEMNKEHCGITRCGFPVSLVQSGDLRVLFCRCSSSASEVAARVSKSLFVTFCPVFLVKPDDEWK